MKNEKAVSKADSYIDYLNVHILPRIDYEKLQNSYSTSDKTYAKGILNLLHQAMVEVYGSEILRSEDNSIEDGFVVIPGVVHGKKSGAIALALLELDLTSSGEHWATDFFTKHGLISQSKNDGTPEALTQLMGILYIPYDYAYTAKIPNDIHIDKNRLSSEITEILQTFKDYSAELLPQDEISIGEEFNQDEDMEV